MTADNEQELLCKKIVEQTEIEKDKYQQILMTEDFNVKIGNHIPGNKEIVSKGERHLKTIIDKQKCKQNKCKQILNK